MADNCVGITLYKDLDFCQGKTVLPGIRGTVYAVPASSITAYPKLPELGSTEATTMESLATYIGNFTLDATGKWIKVAIIDQESGFTSESQGDKPSKTFVNKLTMKYPGADEKAAGFCRQANADNLVYVAQDRNGKWRVFGNEMFQSNTKPQMDSGKAVTDKSGTTLEVEVTDICPAPFYTGTLVTTDGTIDCSKDKTTTTTTP